LGFSLGAAQIGDALHFAAPQPKVTFSVRLRSIVPVDHLELVCNGRVAKAFAVRAAIDHGDFSGSIALKDSGWCLVRASTDAAVYPVLDNYVYATTSPIYVDIAGRPPRSPDDARYFVAWIDRMSETTSLYPDWNGESEKRAVLERLAEARAKFVALQ
jgi:TolB protein